MWRCKRRSRTSLVVEAVSGMAAGRLRENGHATIRWIAAQDIGLDWNYRCANNQQVGDSSCSRKRGEHQGEYIQSSKWLRRNAWEKRRKRCGLASQGKVWSLNPGKKLGPCCWTPSVRMVLGVRVCMCLYVCVNFIQGSRGGAEYNYIEFCK